MRLRFLMPILFLLFLLFPLVAFAQEQPTQPKPLAVAKGPVINQAEQERLTAALGQLRSLQQSASQAQAVAQKAIADSNAAEANFRALNFEIMATDGVDPKRYELALDPADSKIFIYKEKAPPVAAASPPVNAKRQP